MIEDSSMTAAADQSDDILNKILDKITDDFEFVDGYDEGLMSTLAPTLVDAEELHEEDAYAAVFLNVVLIVCVLLAYYIKQHRIYYLPER